MSEHQAGISTEDGSLKPYLDYFGEYLSELDQSAKESAREQQASRNRSMMF